MIGTVRNVGYKFVRPSRGGLGRGRRSRRGRPTRTPTTRPHRAARPGWPVAPGARRVRYRGGVAVARGPERCGHRRRAGAGRGRDRGRRHGTALRARHAAPAPRRRRRGRAPARPGRATSWSGSRTSTPPTRSRAGRASSWCTREHRRAGLGTRIVQALLDRAGRSERGGRAAAAVGARRPPRRRSRSPPRLGFTQARVLWQMRRSLLAAAGRAAPARRACACARSSSAPTSAEFLRVNNAAFDWHPEQGGWDLDQVKLREPSRGSTRTASCSPSTPTTACSASTGPRCTRRRGGTRHEPIGEVYVLGVDPSARGTAPRRRAHPGRAAPPARPRPAPGDAVRRGRQRRRRARLPRLGFTRWDTDVSYCPFSSDSLT